jgi:hypothetical protein
VSTEDVLNALADILSDPDGEHLLYHFRKNIATVGVEDGALRIVYHDGERIRAVVLTAREEEP